METEQGYYEPAVADPSNVVSLNAEMIRSLDYGDKRLYDAAMLREVGDYWTLQLNAPERSPRAKKDIDKLLGRITFELVMMQNDLVREISGDLRESDSLPTEWLGDE